MGSLIDAPLLAEWKAFEAGLIRQRDSSLQAVRSAFPGLNRGQAAMWFERSSFKTAFLKSIEVKFPDTPIRDQKNRYTYIAYHILIGSSGLTIEKAPNMDLPDDLSVRKFFQAILDNPQVVAVNRRDNPFPNIGLIS
jgi:hypothetical protein